MAELWGLQGNDGPVQAFLEHINEVLRACLGCVHCRSAVPGVLSLLHARRFLGWFLRCLQQERFGVPDGDTTEAAGDFLLRDLRSLPLFVRLISFLAVGRRKEHGDEAVALLTWTYDLIVLGLPSDVWTRPEILAWSWYFGCDGRETDALIAAAYARRPELFSSPAPAEGLVSSCLLAALSSLRFFSRPALAEHRAQVCAACEASDGTWLDRMTGLQLPTAVLAWLPEDWLGDRGLLLAVARVDDGGASFGLLPEELRADRTLALAFAERNRNILRLVPQLACCLREDADLIHASARRDPAVLDELCSSQGRAVDDQLLTDMARRHGARFFATAAGKARAGDVRLALEAVRHSHDPAEVLAALSPDLRQHRGLLREVFAGETCRWACTPAATPEAAAGKLEQADLCASFTLVWAGLPAAVTQDWELVAELLADNGGLLGCLGEEHRASRSLVRVASRSQPLALRHAAAAVWLDEADDAQDGACEPPKKKSNTGCAAATAASDGLEAFVAGLLCGNLDVWPLLPARLRERCSSLCARECAVCGGLDRDMRTCLCHPTHLVCAVCAEQLLALAETPQGGGEEAGGESGDSDDERPVAMVKSAVCCPVCRQPTLGPEVLGLGGASYGRKSDDGGELVEELLQRSGGAPDGLRLFD